MFNTSQDILNIVKAISIFIVCGALTWVLVYAGLILRQIFKASKSIVSAITKIDDVLTVVKEKIENTTAYLLLISEGVKKLVDVVKDFTKKNSSNEL